MTTWKPPAPGVLDDTVWPEKLVARAVLPGESDDRLHGYAVLGDVALHYRYSDLIYLAVVGELPDDRASRLFHFGLCAFATVAVNEAPAHVGVLSRICGGSLASAIGAATIAAADQAHHIVEGHRDLLAWLVRPEDPPPATFRTADPYHHAWVRSLRDALPDVSSLHPEMTRDAARLALLFEAGLHTTDQLEAAIVTSRVSGLVAESLLATPADLARYPVKLPAFHYVEDGAAQ